MKKAEVVGLEEGGRSVAGEVVEGDGVDDGGGKVGDTYWEEDWKEDETENYG